MAKGYNVEKEEGKSEGIQQDLITLTKEEVSDIIRILSKMAWNDVNDIIVFFSQKLKKE